MKSYWVYIASNHSRTLYVGITNNIYRRMFEHKKKLVPGFTKRYRINKLVYFAELTDPVSAISYEKKLKGLLRKRKTALIEENNPSWDDLSETWF